jgi:hypothetical protein
MALPIDQSGGTCCHHRVAHRYFADHRLPKFGEHNVDDPLRARRSVAIGSVTHNYAFQLVGPPRTNPLRIPVGPRALHH